jgi:hypothetical protein
MVAGAGANGHFRRLTCRFRRRCLRPPVQIPAPSVFPIWPTVPFRSVTPARPSESPPDRGVASRTRHQKIHPARPSAAPCNDRPPWSGHAARRRECSPTPQARPTVLTQKAVLRLGSDNGQPHRAKTFCFRIPGVEIKLHSLARGGCLIWSIRPPCWVRAGRGLPSTSGGRE